MFTCLWERGRRLRCTHTMHSPTCVSVVVCVARKPRPCLSYSRRRGRINLVLWRSYYKGGGLPHYPQFTTWDQTAAHQQVAFTPTVCKVLTVDQIIAPSIPFFATSEFQAHLHELGLSSMATPCSASSSVRLGSTERSISSVLEGGASPLPQPCYSPSCSTECIWCSSGDDSH